MTPVDPTGGDAHASERVASTIELLVKAGGLLGMLWAFLAKVAKPYHEYRQQQMARTIKAVVAPMLAPIVNDHDLLLEIALDNRERHDEVNALLDALGFTTDRRSTDERRAEIAEMVATLAERRRARRRNPDQ